MSRAPRSPLEWWLLANAAILMAGSTLAVRLLPYRWWRRLALRAIDASRAPRTASLSQIIRAVDAAGVLVPGGGNCLVRALAARSLLARYGFESAVKFGVAKDEPSALRAHAWLDCEGKTVVGQHGKDRFAPLPDAGDRL